MPTLKYRDEKKKLKAASGAGVSQEHPLHSGKGQSIFCALWEYQGCVETEAETVRKNGYETSRRFEKRATHVSKNLKDLEI